MGLLSALLGGQGPRVEEKADISALTWSALLGGHSSKSGVTVSIDAALKVSTVLACCRVLAEGVAQIPLKVYQEKDDGGKRIAKEHPAHRVLYRRPNDWMSSFEFRETMMYHAVLARGAYAYINRVNGKVKELLPILPGCVTPEQLPDWSIVYHVADQHGHIATVPRDRIFHIRGPSWNGFEGLEAINLAREVIGLSVALEESQARLHSNGSRPGGILSVDTQLSEEARTRLRTAWNEAMSGVQNAFKTAVLDGGAKWTPLGYTSVDAQSLETRKHQIEELCRIFRVFPQMVGASDKASTYASAEQFFLAHVIHSLGPWIERWEQAIDRDILTDAEEKEGYFAKFSLGGLLRGDAKTRAEYYSKGIKDGWLTRNETRHLEDLDPIKGLDEPLVPLNMAAASAIPTNSDTPPADSTGTPTQE